MTQTEHRSPSRESYAGCKSAVKWTLGGCLGTSALAAIGAGYGIHKALDPDGTIRPQIDPIIERVTALATAQARFEASGIELPDISPEDLQKYGPSVDQQMLGVASEMFKLPVYDFAPALSPEGGSIKVENTNTWVTVKVGNLRLALLNRMGHAVTLNTEQLSTWFDTFGMTDPAVTAGMPLFYVLGEDYSDLEKAQVDLLTEQYQEHGGFPEDMGYPFCKTTPIPRIPFLGNRPLSISTLSYRAIQTELGDIYAQAGAQGIKEFGIVFGDQDGAPFKLSGDLAKDAQSFVNVCMIGELALGYRGRGFRLSEMIDIDAMNAFDLNTWVIVGNLYVGEDGAFPEPFVQVHSGD